jgi:hypothetical protein
MASASEYLLMQIGVFYEEWSFIDRLHGRLLCFLLLPEWSRQRKREMPWTIGREKSPTTQEYQIT